MLERIASLSPRTGGATSEAGESAAAHAARIGGSGPHLTPSERTLKLWRTAQAVCFDIDCTVARNDQLDLLAEFMGVGDQVAAITNSAMDGSMGLEAALEQRLQVINCTPSDIQAFLKAHPPDSRLTPGARELIQQLQSRGVAVYLISGGFRELCLPIARELGVPPKNVFANRMNFQVDDETGDVTRLVGFDLREPTGHQGGKPRAIARLRELFPYETVVMVGDGITDLEAVQESGGADMFVGFGGIVAREAVVRAANWFVTDFDVLRQALPRHRVAMIGSGAWACAAAKLIAENTAAADKADKYVAEVRMYVYEEEVEGRKLTELINERHENVKYMPGCFLGPNVVACSDLVETVRDATVLVFCAPHQFIHRMVKTVAGQVSKDAIAISLTKGMRVRPDGPQLISELVRKELGVDCSVLMGANIAADIAKGELSEATIGYSVLDHAQLLKDIFERPAFIVTLVPDVVGAEMCGTLKNIVALAAGFVEGLGYGPNTKAAVMRAGLNEMKRFAKALYPTVRDETFFESCGVADLIATCYGGRNRLVAREYVAAQVAGRSQSFAQLEARLLAGQKLQGVLTSNEVQAILARRGWEADYPLFTTVNRIVTEQLPGSAIVEYRASALLPLRSPAEQSGGDLASLALADPTASRATG